jgi:hypothetical protein
MSINSNTNMIAKSLAANLTLPRDQHRTYLAVQAAGGDVTVTISSGASFTIVNGAWWGPQPAPMNDIIFTGAGTLITG